MALTTSAIPVAERRHGGLTKNQARLHGGASAVPCLRGTLTRTMSPVQVFRSPDKPESPPTEPRGGGPDTPSSGCDSGTRDLASPKTNRQGGGAPRTISLASPGHWPRPVGSAVPGQVDVLPDSPVHQACGLSGSLGYGCWGNRCDPGERTPGFCKPLPGAGPASRKLHVCAGQSQCSSSLRSLVAGPSPESLGKPQSM